MDTTGRQLDPAHLERGYAGESQKAFTESTNQLFSHRNVSCQIPASYMNFCNVLQLHPAYYCMHLRHFGIRAAVLRLRFWNLTPDVLSSNNGIQKFDMIGDTIAKMYIAYSGSKAGK